HGFGFAGALQEIGVPPDREAAALALFNLGVELGQLAVLGLVWPALRWLRAHPIAWHRVSRALNIGLALLGAGWSAERAVGGGEPALAVTAPSPENAPSARSALQSVYPSNPEPSPLASDLCELFQRLPRERRAACSGSASGATLERECARVLNGALADGAL